MDEIRNLSKKINSNNLIYYFNGKSDLKDFIGFRVPLDFLKI